MRPKPHNDFTPPTEPQHQLDIERGVCMRCWAGLQQIQHGFPCAIDDAVLLRDVVGKLRRLRARNG